MFERLRKMIYWIAGAVLLYLSYRLVKRLFIRKQEQAPSPTLEVPETETVPVEEIAPEPALPVELEPSDLGLPFPILEAPPLEIAAPIQEADVNLTLPPEVAIESFEEKYNFNWQNPTLRATIYPFRHEKLIDILAIYYEIDLVKKYRGQSSSNALIQAQIKKAEAELRDARKTVDNQLNKLIEEREKKDTLFAGIIGDEKSKRFKQKYYLDREILRLEGSLDELRERKKTLRKRLAWWPNDPERRRNIKCQSIELNPKIRKIRERLRPLTELRALYDRQDELPQVGADSVPIENVMKWEIRAKRQEWEQLSHDQLLRKVIDLINADPDRYPEWLVYMMIHFSGMRYSSAHASWADPRDLIELLVKEDDEEELKMKALKEPQTLPQLSSDAIKDMQSWLKSGITTNEENIISRLISRLQRLATDWRALLEYRVEKLQKEIKDLTDEEVLDRLVQYKADRARAGDPLPNWVWSEIVKFTPLRVNTSDPEWEAYSTERWQSQSGNWADVLNTWENKDITSWRKRHEQTLDLVVTKSVCNEIAEQIQHLRGHAPYAGLTSKPKWYLRLIADENTKDFSYFKQSPDRDDFQPGASILWLKWMAQKPSPWQVAYDIQGYVFIPPGAAGKKSGQKGEVPKKDLIAQELDDDSGWTYQLQRNNGYLANSYMRARPKPNKSQLEAMGISKPERDKILAEYHKTGNREIEYLRWRHEATVVDVVEMIDGWNVLTFETGKIGINCRHINALRGNPLVFVGFVPDVWSLPEEKRDLKDRLLNIQQWKDNDARLVKMLDWNRILPGANLKARVRPKIKPFKKDVVITTPIGSATPQRQALVIREQIKVYTINGRDKQNRPKFVGAPPTKLHRGDLVKVYDKIRESQHDAGDGIIKANDGEYVKLSQSSVPGASGKYLQRSDIEFMDQGKWMAFKVHSGNVNFQVLKGYDESVYKKPWFDPTPEKNSVILSPSQPGVKQRVRVSTIHTECSLDIGDGVIQSSGLVETFYLVLECPALPKARGYFIKTGWVVPENESVDFD